MSTPHKHAFRVCSKENFMGGWVCTDPFNKNEGHCGKEAFKGCENDGDAYCKDHGPVRLKPAKKVVKKVAPKKATKKVVKAKRK
jgi:hypothetical protein